MLMLMPSDIVVVIVIGIVDVCSQVKQEKRPTDLHAKLTSIYMLQPTI